MPEHPLTVRSRANSRFRLLRELAHSGRARREMNRTVLDGVHLVQRARASGVVLESVFVSESRCLRPEIAGLLADLADVPLVVLDDPLFAAASPVEEPSGIAAILAIPAPRTGGGTSGDCVVLNGVQDSGNVGTILRTCEAVGIDLIYMTPGCAQGWSPRTLRAGMGAQFGLRIVEQVAVAELADRLRGSAGMILAASPHSGHDLYDCDLVGPVAWLFGSEGAGLSPGVAALATHHVTIPMATGVESVNVGVAAGVCLFEQFRQRREFAGAMASPDGMPY